MEDSAVTVRRKPTPPEVWRPVFLAALAVTGNWSESCRLAQVRLTTALHAKTNSEKFRAECDEAEREACDSLQSEAWRRGRDGVEKPLYQNGKRVIDYDEIGIPHPVVVREYSDSLLALLLKAHLPEKFNPATRTEISGPQGAPLAIETQSKVLVAVQAAEQAFIDALAIVSPNDSDTPLDTLD